MCKLISKIVNKLFPPKPHWQIIELTSGTQVSCSQCGCEADYMPVFIPREGDTLHSVAVGAIKVEEGFYMPKRCPNCGASLFKDDVYYIPAREEVDFIPENKDICFIPDIKG